MSDEEDKKSDGIPAHGCPSKFAQFDKCRVGDFLSMTEYYKVTQIKEDGLVCVTPLNKPIVVGSGVVNDHCYSADQFETEKTVTRTELVNILTHRVGDKVFTVEFEKQLTPEVLDTHLQASAYNGEGTPTKRRKILKDAMKGMPRKLIGRMKQLENGMGRSEVYDLELPPKNNVRQVDHRTIKSLILMGVKYTVK
jgi:hypothetical protein